MNNRTCKTIIRPGQGLVKFLFLFPKNTDTTKQTEYDLCVAVQSGGRTLHLLKDQTSVSTDFNPLTTPIPKEADMLRQQKTGTLWNAPKTPQGNSLTRPLVAGCRTGP